MVAAPQPENEGRQGTGRPIQVLGQSLTQQTMNDDDIGGFVAAPSPW